MKWMYVENKDGSKFPEWLRSAALAEDGTVFVPLAIAGNENTAFLCAMFDGTRVIEDSGHLYVPADWLGGAMPSTAEICAKIAGNVMRTLAPNA